MNQKPILRNVLVAAAIGVLVGLVIGVLNHLSPGTVSGSTATVGVGVAIGITFVLLNSRKS